MNSGRDRETVTATYISSLHGVRSVLDVGCRQMRLRRLLPGLEVHGLDLDQNADQSVTYVGNLLEVEITRKYDVVTALDVLEHLESPAGGFSTLLELSNRFVIVSLPNVADMNHRLRFLRTGIINGKYGMRYPEPKDRHRWVVTYREAVRWCQTMSAVHSLDVRFIEIRIGDSRRTLRRMSSWALPKNLFVQQLIAVFELRRGIQ